MQNLAPLVHVQSDISDYNNKVEEARAKVSLVRKEFAFYIAANYLEFQLEKKIEDKKKQINSTSATIDQTIAANYKGLFSLLFCSSLSYSVIELEALHLSIDENIKQREKILESAEPNIRMLTVFLSYVSMY